MNNFFELAQSSKEVIALICIFILPFFVVLIKNIFWDLYFWQIKEYRWDRFWTHIRWDQDSKSRNFFLISIKFILFSCITLFLNLPIIAIFGLIITYIVWTFESFEFLKDSIANTLRKPALKNPRNLLIIIMSLAFVSIVIAFLSWPFIELSKDVRSNGFENGGEVLESLLVQNIDSTETLIYPDIYILLMILTMFGLLIDLATPFWLPIFVFLTAPIAWFRRNITIFQAQRKLRLMKKRPIIIGITGSVGKTTTKEILYEVLKNKFKVAKTPENYNTAFGVAWAILNNVNNDTEVFIAEMGAYKKGEIKRMVKAFRNDISLITDIDTQHVGIYGSRENLASAKGEIIKYLNKTGIGILNGDNKYCRQLSTSSMAKLTYVSTDRKNDEKLDKLESSKVKVLKGINNKAKGLTFTVFDQKEFKIDTKFEQDHLITNLMLVYATAKHLNMDGNEIKKELERVDMQLPRLTFDTGDNNTAIINDSYNSSRKGMIAAFEYMNKIKKEKSFGKRIVITPGIKELGREKQKIYKSLSNKLKNDFDILITSDTLLYKTMLGVVNDSKKVLKIKKAKDSIYKVRKLSSPNDVILIAGRVDPKIIKELVSDKA